MDEGKLVISATTAIIGGVGGYLASKRKGLPAKSWALVCAIILPLLFLLLLLPSKRPYNDPQRRTWPSGGEWANIALGFLLIFLVAPEASMPVLQEQNVEKTSIKKDIPEETSRKNTTPSNPEGPPRLSYDSTGLGNQDFQFLLKGWLHINYGAAGDPQLVITSNGMDTVTLYSVIGKETKVELTAILSQALISCPGYDVTVMIGYGSEFKTKPFTKCLKGYAVIGTLPKDSHRIAQVIQNMHPGPIIFRQGKKVITVVGEGNAMDAMYFSRWLHPWGMIDGASPNP